MKKNVIICCSHLYVPTALTFILSHPDITHYIYTNNHSIKLLFEGSLLVDSVLEEPQGLDSFNLFKVHKLKRWIKQQFTEIKPDTILFFHDGYCMPINWYMKNQKDNVQINYCPTYVDNIKRAHINSFIQICSILKDKVLWGINTIPIIGLNKTITPYLDPSFFSLIGANILKIPVDKQLIKNNINLICPTISGINNDAIVFLQCEIVGYSISEEVYINYINRIISSLDTSKCLFKAKPGRTKCYGSENALIKIPDYISASLILNNFKVVIGTSSTVLAQSANEGVLAISLMELIPTQDEKEKKYVIDYLKNLSSYIKFPKTFEELNELINNA